MLVLQKIDGGFQLVMGDFPSSLDGLFHGKSQTKMDDDLGVTPSSGNLQMVDDGKCQTKMDDDSG